MSCGCANRNNCPICAKQKKPGPNIPPCACAKAFDDAFIRSIFAAYSFNPGDDPVAQAALLQTFFSPTGCQQFGFDPPTCGTANVQAENQSINEFLASVGGSLNFDIFNISRTLAPDGCTVLVTVTHTAVGVLPPPIGVIDQRLTTTEIVINPQCQIELVRFFDVIREVSPIPLAASSPSRSAMSVPAGLFAPRQGTAVPNASWAKIAREYGKKPA